MSWHVLARPLLWLALVPILALSAVGDDPPPRANDVCPVDEKAVDKSLGMLLYRREAIAFCADGCKQAFAKVQAPYMNKMRDDPAKYAYRSRWPKDEILLAAKKAVAANNGLCPISEQPVRVEGKVVEYQGQRIAIRCACCAKKFEEKPETYMPKMRADPRAFAYDLPPPPKK
jgi:hypothetical protein